MRRAAGRWAVLAVVVLVLSELASSLALRVIERKRGLRYSTYASLLDGQRDKVEKIVAGDGTWYTHIDADLGWVTTPGVVSGAYAVNRPGQRATHEYAPQARPGVTRIAAFGDSFVHGDEVTTEQAWPAQLEGLDSDLEVLNYGVTGYGIDQAMLRYEREGARFEPDRKSVV